MSAIFDGRRDGLAEALHAAALSDDALLERVQAVGPRGVYLARSFLTGRIPTELQVADDHAQLLDDPERWWQATVHAGRRLSRARGALPVRAASGLVVDVTDTASSPYTTGIQRVARELVRAWSEVEPLELVVWRRLTGELLRADEGEAERAGGSSAGGPRVQLVPVGARLILPEIAVDRDRAQRLASIARFGADASLAVGFDCIPITTAETTGPGMPGAFARYLSGLARFDVVAAISRAAATEFAGWARMLPSAGLRAPRVIDVELPITPLQSLPETEGAVRAALGIGERPVVLVVGSHEPRKNHLTVLAAFENAWRSGHDFAAVLVGGNSWKAEEFTAFATRLREAGRPLVLASNVPDERVAALYRLARASVFCSLNEGFGLPVAESLAVGTPVVTADFGSQRDIGEGRGAVLVDPRSMSAIEDAVVALLTDDAFHARLVAETRGLEPGSWERYASAIRSGLGA
ncbi:glycosyltransferase family 4 protein [Protaetiibacter larvae]|uniref:Glycosyltransferase family 4 protein n=1 Tax=Protaetiibacter larvae TaxID=2592654 RepID=A0A5C1Y453_9MICO|nr:glycosyltransferase family 1 protein [Protaetiibacter larvae]QEO08624.1 glycosyltransferase family 4 protein [Protaetiibacter larvae]